MNKKCLSIITNFGCHYTCPYCIVKNNNICVPTTTIEGLDNLKQTILDNDINVVSISGGGDPLYDFEKHLDWYDKLFDILEDVGIPCEMHTSYINSGFPMQRFNKVVYHLRGKWQLNRINKFGSQKVRVVYVVTDTMNENDILDISDYIESNKQIDELTFRQMVNKDYELSYHLHDFLKKGHKKFWWYVEQCDYNLYYAENKVYEKYKDLKK